ncbi:hypothetical protein WL76_21260 [Burkholderia ubonensis]|uniref:DUF7019 family protein n=1 Tax=Burkholderia ubonensis TaxID=101571 RepID=UPI000756D016|nr:SAVMC3_10250 family protein [Burkholderia ubonensis]KWE50900.1 hypothetical protein WL76_21260 [Burkholderia ubonensis]
MDNYLYISKAKVESMLPQVPHSPRSKVGLSFDVNVGVAKAGVKTEGDTGLKDDPISRLLIVDNYVRANCNIGSMDLPDEWIEDTLEARVTYADGERRSVVLFVGRTEARTRWALGGSAAHLMSRVNAPGTDIGWSFMPDLLQSLKSMAKQFEKEPPGEPFLERSFHINTESMEEEWTDYVTEIVKMTTQEPPITVKFLARRIFTGQHRHQGHRVVLATPLYVIQT